MRRYLLTVVAILAAACAYPADDHIEFATWNLEWFNSKSRGFPENTRGGPTYGPRDGDALAATASIVKKHGLDCVGLQEIESKGDLQCLLACLPGFCGALLEDTAQQHCALLWDPEQCSVTIRPGLSSLALTSGLRQGLHASVKAGQFDFDVMVVHLANADGQVEQQVSLLQGWLRNGGPTDEDVVIAGDFNLTPREKPLKALLADSLLRWCFAGLTELTPTRPPWPGGGQYGKTIDHIFMTARCYDNERWGDAWVPREDLAFGGRYRELVSDHLPVIQSFHTDSDDD
ncbi:MAG: endonuclease/exonuclease/phosphatase family protein [Armatimonadia bacterium]